MGIRAAHEENYTQQTRGMYLAGLYHRAGRNETNELINVPDIIGMDIELDGIHFTLLSGRLLTGSGSWILPMANCVVA